MREYIVVCALDTFKQRVVDGHEHPERRAAFAMNQWQQRLCGLVEALGAARDLGQECALVGCGSGAQWTRQK